MMRIGRFFEFMSDALAVILIAGLMLGVVITAVYMVWMEYLVFKTERRTRKIYRKLERRMAKIDV